MLYPVGIVGLALLALWIFCIFDVIGTDEGRCRNLPKTLWLLLVIFIPNIGGIAWLIMGRPEQTSFQPGSSAYRKAPPGFDPVRTNEQSPVDLESLSDVVREREELARLRVREEQLRRREQELREREEELRRREND